MQPADALEPSARRGVGACHRGSVERRDAGKRTRPEVEHDRVEVAADRHGREGVGAEERDHRGVGEAHPHVDERDQP